MNCINYPKNDNKSKILKSYLNVYEIKLSHLIIFVHIYTHTHTLIHKFINEKWT